MTSIWTVKLDGSEPHKIAESEIGLHSPRWSPDGSAIYYLLGRSGASQELWMVAVSHISGERTGKPTVVEGDLGADDIAFSRNSDLLAYTRETLESNLWLADLSSQPSRITQLTTGTYVYETPSISPDGTRIAFARGDGRKSNVFVMPMQGGPAQQVTFLDTFTSNPVWSPDSAQLAFASLQGGAPRIWTVSAGGGEPRPFFATRLSGTSIGAMLWAPSRNILYQAIGNTTFRFLDPRTGDETEFLGDAPGWKFNPAFSPDGRELAVMWNRPPRGVWVFPLPDSSEPREMRQLTGRLRASSVRQSESVGRRLGKPMTSDVFYPFGWSADKSEVYGIDENGESIWAIPAAGGLPKVVVPASPDKAKLYGASISSDGKEVVLSRSLSRTDVWIAEGLRSR